MPERSTTPSRDIVVGYDGAPEAKAALGRAEAVARGPNARIKLVTVVTPPVAAPLMVPGAFAPDSPPEPDRVMSEGVNSVDRTLAAEAVRLDGDPATQLLRGLRGGSRPAGRRIPRLRASGAGSPRLGFAQGDP